MSRSRYAMNEKIIRNRCIRNTCSGEMIHYTKREKIVKQKEDHVRKKERKYKTTNERSVNLKKLEKR